MTKTTLQPIPYLGFDGNCAEAMTFYAKLLGGEVVAKHTFGDLPPEMQCAPEHASRVMNMQIRFPGGALLYGGDCPPDAPTKTVTGFMITLNFDTAEEGQAVFDRLVEGGTVDMPYAETFWADKFGMCTDRFGIPWAINGNVYPTPNL